MKWLIGISVLATSIWASFREGEEFEHLYFPFFLVNYSALDGDRYKDDLAAKIFDLVIEQEQNEGKFMLEENPSLHVLKYRSMCESRSSLLNWDEEVNIDERCFLHSYEPAALSFIIVQDSALAVRWLPDRRFDNIAGYLVMVGDDSLDRGSPVSPLSPERECILGQENFGKFVHIETVTEDGDTAWYSEVRRISYESMPTMGIVIDSLSFRSGESVESLMVFLRFTAPVEYDSIVLQVDWNHNDTLEPISEHFRFQCEDTSAFCLAIWQKVPGYRAGTPFNVKIYNDGGFWTIPEDYFLSTNVNNRVVYNRYGLYVMNILSETWRNFIVNSLRYYLDTGNYDGLFLDNTILSVPEWMVDCPFPPFDYDSLLWRAAVFSFVNTLKQTFDPNPVYINGIAVEGTDSLLYIVDGAMYENWVYLLTGPPTLTKWKYFENRALHLSSLSSSKTLLLSNAPKENPQARIFALSSYLLIMKENLLFYNADRYDYLALLPEMSLPMLLGNPVDTAYYDIDELLHTTGCYVRRFEKGLVIVNPTDQQLDFPISTPLYRVTVTEGTLLDGASLETVYFDSSILIMPPKSAEVFLTMSVVSPRIDSVWFFPEVPTGFSDNVVNVRVLHRDSLSLEMSLERFDGPLHVYLKDDGVDPDSVAGDSIFSARFELLPGFVPHADTLWFTVFTASGLITIHPELITPVPRDPTNLLYNWSFEIDRDSDRIPDSWYPYCNGFVYDTTIENAYTGRHSVMCSSFSVDSAFGIYYVLNLNQAEAHNIVISAFSKSIDVGGSEDQNYALYFVVYFKDTSYTFEDYVSFPVGTHGWVYAKKLVFAEIPIEKVKVYLYFKYHTGTVWFDDVGVYEAVPMDVDEKGELKIEKPDFYFTVIPNPVGDLGILRAYVPGKEPRVLRLYNTAGRLVRTFGLKPGLNLIRWETGDLPDGAYFLYSESPKRALKTLILK